MQKIHIVYLIGNNERRFSHSAWFNLTSAQKEMRRVIEDYPNKKFILETIMAWDHIAD